MDRNFRIGLLSVAGVGVLALGGFAAHQMLTKLWATAGTRLHIKPTYPGDQMATALKQMCAKDYHMTIEARRHGDTLQAFFWRVGLMKGAQAEIRAEAAESLERVLLCATRIALSTDAPLKFIEVKMTDVLTGASVTLWRYVPDIKDSMYTRLAEDEYINRLVLEISAEGSSTLEGRQPHWDTPITMEEFLGKQVVLRAKRQSPVGLQAHEDVSEPKTLVVVIDNWPAIEQEGDQEQTKVADLMQKITNSVVKGYRFDGFNGVILQDPRGTAVRSWKL